MLSLLASQAFHLHFMGQILPLATWEIASLSLDKGCNCCVSKRPLLKRVHHSNTALKHPRAQPQLKANLTQL